MSRRFYALTSSLIKTLFPIRGQRDMSAVRKILVIGAGGIGDVLMKTSLFDSLRRGFPSAEIVFFTSSGPAHEIMEHHPAIDRFILIEGGEALSLGRPAETLRLIRSLRAERFDAVLTTHYGLSFKGAFFAYILGGPVRAGFDRGGRGRLYTDRVEVEDVNARHAVDWNMSLAESLGIDSGSRALSLHLTEKDRGYASEFLGSSGLDAASPIVALFPGSKRKTRLWPAERFARLAALLAERYGLRALVLGGEAERAAAAEISASITDEADRTGRTRHGPPLVAIGQTIRQTAALIERSSLLVSCDSGPVHIAAAAGTPVVALFGPERPERVGPYSTRSAVVRHSLPCSPCFEMDCRFGLPRCMDLITVEEVAETIDKHSHEWGLDPHVSRR